MTIPHASSSKLHLLQRSFAETPKKGISFVSPHQTAKPRVCNKKTPALRPHGFRDSGPLPIGVYPGWTHYGFVVLQGTSFTSIQDRLNGLQETTSYQFHICNTEEIRRWFACMQSKACPKFVYSAPDKKNVTRIFFLRDKHSEEEGASSLIITHEYACALVLIRTKDQS